MVIGNCGFAFAPVRAPDRDRAMLTMARNEAVPMECMREGMPWDWETYPEFLDSLDRTPKGVNILSYVGLNPLMVWVMGSVEEAKGRPLTEAERTEAERLLSWRRWTREPAGGRPSSSGKPACSATTTARPWSPISCPRTT